jgi:polysaccharide biosynthesis/export protein
MRMRFLFFILTLVTFQTLAQVLPDSTQKKPVNDSLSKITQTVVPIQAALLPSPTPVPIDDYIEDSTAYRLRGGDRLKIRNLLSISIIYPEAAAATISSDKTSGVVGGEKPYEITVDKRGNITLPRVGRIKVGGLTRLQTVAAVEKAYSNVLTDPIFEVEIMNLYIKVLGSVNKQGIIPLQNESMSLGEVIASAGGINFVTADKTIRLIRTQENQQVEINYDVRDLSNPSITNLPVYNGDYVFVPPSKVSLRDVKIQRISNIVQPIALVLNALAVYFLVFKTPAK